MSHRTPDKHSRIELSHRKQLLLAIAQGNADEAAATASLLAAGGQLPLPGFSQLRLANPANEKVFLDALWEAVDGAPAVWQAICAAFARCPDPAYLAAVLAREGLDGLKRIGPRLYWAVRPALARRYRNPEEAWIATSGGEWLLEPKLDGWECQIHMGPQGARLYSRRGRELSRILLTVAKAVEKMLEGYAVILESEVVAVDPETNKPLPRADMRRLGVSHRAVVFDLLYLGDDYTRYPCAERFEALCQLPLKDATDELTITEQVRVDTLSTFESAFRSAVLQGHEGIIGKRPDAPYEAGARTNKRIKIKPVDTVDAVLIGYNSQNDAYLAAVYDIDANSFVPFVWISSGLNVDEKRTLAEERDRAALPDSSRAIIADRQVDLQLQPLIVVEIAGDHIHPTDKYPCGLHQDGRGWTLMGAKFVRLRPDKGPNDVTTLEEFLSLPVMAG
jgi:DNA ligase-1